MRYLFLVGMPGSGKSSIGSLLAKKLSSLFMKNVPMIEMSNVIHHYAGSSGLPPIDMPSGDSNLKEFLWVSYLSFYHQIAVISGVRESFLTVPPADLYHNADIDIATVSIDCSIDLRRLRYDSRPENKYSFEESERRANELEVPSFMENCSFHFENEGLDLKSIVDIIEETIVLDWMRRS